MCEYPQLTFISELISIMHLRHHQLFAVVFALFCSNFQGCTATQSPPEASPSESLSLKSEAINSSTSSISKTPDQEPKLATNSKLKSVLKPDAVIKFQMYSVILSPEMQLRLQRIADIIHDDERAMIRLIGYVPGGGSSALNIGEAEKILRVVKQELEKLHVPARRIQMASFGEEHKLVKQRNRQWVEIYIQHSKR